MLYDSFHKTLRQLRFSSLTSVRVCTCHKFHHQYLVLEMYGKSMELRVKSIVCIHVSVFLFQSAAATVEPPQNDSSECRPDIPGISDHRTG